MTVVALDNGKSTAIFSPVPLPKRTMAEIEALGAPAYLIVPNFAHRLDIRPFKPRYPRAKVVARAGSRAQVEEAVRVDTSRRDLGKRVDLIVVPGMGMPNWRCWSITRAARP